MKQISRGRFLRDSATLLAFLSGYINSFSDSLGKENNGMLHRTVRSSGEKIPAIGLGTWQTMDVSSDSSSLTTLMEVWNEFIRSGGGVVDSSPMYGRSEEIVGLLSSGLSPIDKKRIFFATKVWIRGETAGKTQIDSSFRRFGVDKIDIFQIHNLVDAHIHLKYLKTLQEKGSIRYVGLTHYVSSAFSEMEGIAKKEKVEFLQIPYSIVTREAETRILPFAESNGISVLINRPFEEGQLFRRVKGKVLPDFFREWDCESFGQAFLKFILSHSAVTCAIPATSKLSHLRDNLKAGFGKLPTGRDREEFKKRLLQEL
ncbi:aldo/keto reductase [Leptospira gomenensis]|uniref:Aldo/keto reductase n=1 Tax=Leptospira gomenensis TaxID=2484974 RepID=A0A5F1Y9B6_9LEPT|nr:aldo/keto reductase [Leptospira gomenensis]TGK32700.1 aldo/keto reductase [Leptospira gomenensis]TGK36847.1 aldo/keto reductase [Leptospira gomenensis]TGK39923.1 aldo/keto reductase [Leptospira gomenensis]TGK58058.1 aldo/keto reductase [Leptospira gomenensis]